MNYYQVLRVSSTASHVDIDRAYQKLVRESRFDSAMSRKDIETAYRILTDPTKRALYDAALAEDGKKTTVRTKTVGQQFTLDRMLVALIILFVIAVGFFGYRYSYFFRSFTKGDVLIYINTGKEVGTVVTEQDDHPFGGVAADAYLIRTPRGDIWFPKEEVKLTCRKKQ